MYSVSNEFLTAMAEPVQQHKIEGSIGNVSFGPENILSGSFLISDQCSDSNAVGIGQVYIGELSATFRNTGISAGSWEGLTITPTFYLYTSNGWEGVPLGVYTVSEATISASGVTVKAYDNMIAFDKAFAGSLEDMTAYAILSAACSACGVTLGSTSAEISAMANGTLSVSLSANSDVETWRDVVSWVAQMLGANATIDRTGELVIFQYGTTSVATYDDTHRHEGATFADFNTRITGISLTIASTNTSYYYAEDTDDALTYDLGANPFLQIGTDTDRESACTEILTALQNVNYAPFEVNLTGCPVYDLGDVLTFSDGILSSSKTGCVTYFTYNYNAAYKVKGAGKNPAEAAAKSKTDKTVSALASTVAQEVNQLSVVQNATAVTIAESTETSILAYNFEVTDENNTTLIDISVALTASAVENIADDVYTLSDIVAALSFYVDDSEVTVYDPQFIIDEGKDTMTFNYSLSGLATGAHEFDVRLTMDGGTGSIDAGDVHEMLWGYGITFEVYVKSIEVTTMPNVTAFYSDDTFGYTGMVVSGIYNNGTTTDVTADCTVEPTSGTALTDYETGTYTAAIAYALEDGSELTTSYNFNVIEVSLKNAIVNDKASSELARALCFINTDRKKVISAGSLSNQTNYANDTNLVGIPYASSSYYIVFRDATSASDTYTLANISDTYKWVPVAGGVAYVTYDSSSNFFLYYVEGNVDGVTGETLVSTYARDTYSSMGILADINHGYFGKYVCCSLYNSTDAVYEFKIIDITDGSEVYSDSSSTDITYVNSVITDDGDIYILLNCQSRSGTSLTVEVVKISSGTASLLSTTVDGEQNGGTANLRIDYDRDVDCLVLTVMGEYYPENYYATYTTRIYQISTDDLSLIQEVDVPEYIEFTINGSWAVSGTARLYLNCTELYYKYYSGYENKSANYNFGYATDDDGAYIILGPSFLSTDYSRYFGDNETQCAKTGHFTYTLRHAMYYYDQIPYYIDNIYLQESSGNFMGEVTI